jgi:hypothetical protein
MRGDLRVDMRGEDSGESVAMKMAMGVAMLFNQKVDMFVGSCSLDQEIGIFIF